MTIRVWSKLRTGFRLVNQDIKEWKARRLVTEGRSYLAGGDLERALDCGKRALSAYYDFNDAYHLMAEVLMPGDDYIALLSRFHDCLRPDAYLEIGVSRGESLALAEADTNTVGIDPHPRIEKSIRSHARLYPITSDEFFGAYDLMNELGVSRLGLVFIDGLHRFEQVLKDFINIERYADTATVVLVHDCLPVASVLATRTPATDLWCGDVWKIVHCLKKYRPDLNVGVIPTRPSGLAIITNLNPYSATLRDNFDAIAREYKEAELNYEYLDLGERGLTKMVPGLVANNWEEISQRLSSHFSPV